MKTGTPLLTLAGLLLTLPCLAAPAFDHDPMSIDVGSSQIQTASLEPVLTDRNPFNKLPIGTRYAASAVLTSPPNIKVFGSNDGMVSGDKIKIEFFTDFDPSPGVNAFKGELTENTDYTIDHNPAPISPIITISTSYEADFSVTFLAHSLNGKDHRKVYVVAYKTSEPKDKTRQSCFQTINLFR